MSIHNLSFLFEPKSVTVVGASTRPGSVGNVVLRNLLAGGFGGPILPVNPKYEAVAGVLAYPDLRRLPVVPDLAVVCTPPQTVPRILSDLGQRGGRAAVVLTAGLTSDQEQAMLDASRPHGLRIMGPNCLGLIIPGIGLDASFAHLKARPGNIGFLSQSGALCTAVLDWASANNIGFSHFLSLGNMADVDFGDALDYLGSEESIDAILLYIESIRSARKFLSAARAAARNKVVLAIKAGRMEEGARAVVSHTGSLAGADDVYDAAIRRSGMLRVYGFDELFGAVETLARARPLKSRRLAILTNGGGPGVLATDVLVEGGGELAPLSEKTIAALDACLPANWSRANPVDIIGDADATRYAKALECLLADEGVDSILVLHVPTAIASSEEAARAIARTARACDRNVLTCWLGRETVGPARRCFAQEGIPTYDTPEQAVGAFLHLVNYRRNQETLMEVPRTVSQRVRPDRATAQRLIREVLEDGREILTEPESKAILTAYGIPVARTLTAENAGEAARLATEIGFPVALKILSPDVTHKSDVGGVVLDLEGPDEVRRAAEAMGRRLAEAIPEARLTGFTVQEMVRRPQAHELIVGSSTDPVFGPIVLFGQGGTAVEVVPDRALGLPPLNMNLAREMIDRTRVARLLAGYRNRPAADLEAISLTILQVAQLVADLHDVAECDINPLLADAKGVVALDARVRVSRWRGTGPRLAIRPYPEALEETVRLTSGRTILLRPIRPEDEPAHHAFHERLTPEDIRFRFFGMVRQIPHSQMARFTQIDYDREMAFIAAAEDDAGRPETLGVVRTHTDPDNTRAEFAIIVRSDMKGKGLGKVLLDKMVRYCRDRRTQRIVGQVMAANTAMLRLASSLGFRTFPWDSPDVVEVRLDLS